MSLSLSLLGTNLEYSLNPFLIVTPTVPVLAITEQNKRPNATEMYIYTGLHTNRKIF